MPRTSPQDFLKKSISLTFLLLAHCSPLEPATASAQPASQQTFDQSKRRAIPANGTSNSVRRKSQRPDPRYRPPKDFAELQTIAGEIARASGKNIQWRLQYGENPGPLARIRGTINDCTIFVHPVASRKIPLNTWAFIFGHEFAHLAENLGTHSQTNPSNELKADIAGARYAMASGFRLESFLGWVLTEPNQTSNTHGSLHQRVQSVATRFGIPQNVIQAEAKRHQRYRATR